ncbi:MAG TPA: transcriptional repressor, partial [Caldilinea sp.]|nr:transcriptional repressor [Caldilinea sp.]
METSLESGTTQEKNDRFLQILKQAGLRLTPQRRAICAWLAETERHPTAYELYEDLALTHPEISRA